MSIGKDGTLYLPDSQGRIWTAQNGGQGKLQEVAYVGGKPLGGHVYPNGDAIFCDAVKVSRNARQCHIQHTPVTTVCSSLHTGQHGGFPCCTAIVIAGKARMLNTCKVPHS